ncbi:hypothetical protein BHE74_00055725 [Ensete ventricosum]|uniref:Uncharacterized protein n=1 Tax=Ensete ventricosum TaxID=4639 RepID=A0A426Y1A5_ENSVE|nr:hypothetical protein B296_00055081 [Ensete ventricosum]RWW38980.1 hypothetical protein BHE74_00055725 [Ensete ventricosum]
MRTSKQQGVVIVALGQEHFVKHLEGVRQADPVALKVRWGETTYWVKADASDFGGNPSLLEEGDVEERVERKKAKVKL